MIVHLGFCQHITFLFLFIFWLNEDASQVNTQQRNQFCQMRNLRLLFPFLRQLLQLMHHQNSPALGADRVSSVQIMVHSFGFLFLYSLLFKLGVCQEIGWFVHGNGINLAFWSTPRMKKPGEIAMVVCRSDFW